MHKVSCNPKTLASHLEINTWKRTGKPKGSSQRQENGHSSPERQAGWSPTGAAEREGNGERGAAWPCPRGPAAAGAAPRTVRAGNSPVPSARSPGSGGRRGLARRGRESARGSTPEPRINVKQRGEGIKLGSSGMREGAAGSVYPTGSSRSCGQQGQNCPIYRAPARPAGCLPGVFPAGCSADTSRIASLSVCLFRYFWHGSRPPPAAAGAAAVAGGARRCPAGDPRRMRGCGRGTGDALRAAPSPSPVGSPRPALPRLRHLPGGRSKS